MEDLTGKQLNQYQIVTPLGQRGMASIYKAYQPSMERYVALKIFPRHLASDPQFMRFEQETKVIAKLQHRHILPVFNYGEAEWEKAARSETGFAYPWGDTFEANRSNYCAGTVLCPAEPDDGYVDTAPVGSFVSGASPYDVHDMAENVNEWVADWLNKPIGWGGESQRSQQRN